ncbi:unnamed protein product [Rotaria socialis]
MVLFKKVVLIKNQNKVVLHDLNLDNVKKIMDQNELNTVLLDRTRGRFLFYDCIEHIANKYELYDINVLSKSSELFDAVLLLKSDENKIKNAVEYAENYRIDCILSIANENKQQEKHSSEFCATTINNINLCDINEEQHEKNQINFEKTILQYDDNDDDSCRPTFNDIIKLNDVEISFSDELEDDEYDENIMNEQIENDVNDKNPMIPVDNDRSHCYVVIPFDDNHFHSNVISSQDTFEIINTKDLTVSEKCIIETLAKLSNRMISLEENINKRLTDFENHINKRLSGFENHVNKRLSGFENHVNKRLSRIENNMNLIYERQSLQSLLKLLDTVYLITCERLENRTFFSDKSDLTLKFFRFVSKQLIKNYSAQWSPYTNIIKKLSLKPKCLEINLLGFGKLQKNLSENKKISFIESPKLLCVDNTTNYRSSYVRHCNTNLGKPFTHVLVFEGTTSPVHFEIELFKNSNLSSSDNKIIWMKNLLRKLLQLERIIFFLSFYYKIDLSQFFAGLICFHFYHNSHIDTNLLLQNVMSSTFVEAVPLLHRLYLIDQFIFTY